LPKIDNNQQISILLTSKYVTPTSSKEKTGKEWRGAMSGEWLEGTKQTWFN
jgi:hypothetical protein